MAFFSRNKTPSGPPEFIIAGLGNPGKKYEFTRHNAGFLFADMLAEKCGVKIDKIQFKSVTGMVDIGGHKCLLMKPQTFMNNSGEAVRDAAKFYKIPPENVIIVFDDISLPCGKMRIRRKGSDGGHNGMKSIIYLTGSDKYPRIKLGIGEKPHPAYELADWVLSTFKKDELKALAEACEKACDAAELMVQGNIDKAMSNFNS
ncbi:MAG: aminoacyl-tRNA hydrolase [Clostridia bacterium]|nr:aminoacyl-tRNA hydrolase [Clostridia bacterium]